MDRKQVKAILKTSCRGVLEDLLDNVGFRKEESDLFRYRYIMDYAKPKICMLIHCGESKYNNGCSCNSVI